MNHENHAKIDVIESKILIDFEAARAVKIKGDQN
jgi:hypothetical protein